MTIKVDLLPTEKRGFRLDAMTIVLFILICFSTVGFWFYSQTLSQQIEVEKQKIAKVKDEIKENEKSRPIIQEKKNRLKKLDDQIQMIKNLVHDPKRYGNLLQEISLLLPPNVFLNQLNIEPGPQTISFGGEAADAAGTLPLATISQMMKSLNESRYFNDANLASAQQVKGKGFTFQLTLHYDQNAAATLDPGQTDSSAPGGQGQPAQQPGGQPTEGPPGPPPGPGATPTPGAATPGAPATPGAATPNSSATPSSSPSPGR